MILSSVSGSRILCVGAVVTDGRGRLLLIRRGHEPGAGLWSLPGGRVEPGETDAEALVREMEEETGLTVQPGRLIGQVQRPGLAGDVLDIRDYAATVTGGTLRAGDDAADARWVDPEDLAVLAMTEGLVEALTEWGVLGQERTLLSRFSVPSLRTLFVPSSLGHPLVAKARLYPHQVAGFLSAPEGVSVEPARLVPDSTVAPAPPGPPPRG